jgi:hypothetical protein
VTPSSRFTPAARPFDDRKVQGDDIALSGVIGALPYRGPMPVEKAPDIVFRDVPGRLDRSACAALETWLGRSTEPGSREDVGVLALGEDLSGPAPEPETRPVVPPRGVPRV